jgi:hypothetical protein
MPEERRDNPMESSEQEQFEQGLAEVGVAENYSVEVGKDGREAPAAKKRRSDAGLPRRRSLLLSRAASARFVRVAACLPGGEEELAKVLEPWLDQLFCGDLVVSGDDSVRGEAGDGLTLEEMALEYQRAQMKGGSDES